MQLSLHWVASPTSPALQLCSFSQAIYNFTNLYPPLPISRYIHLCNMGAGFSTDWKIGWITEKPIMSQITLSLQHEQDSTILTCSVESQATGIAQLAEPLRVKETENRIRKSFKGLKIYLEAQA